MQNCTAILHTTVVAGASPPAGGVGSEGRQHTAKKKCLPSKTERHAKKDSRVLRGRPVLAKILQTSNKVHLARPIKLRILSQKKLHISGYPPDAYFTAIKTNL